MFETSVNGDRMFIFVYYNYLLQYWSNVGNGNAQRITYFQPLSIL